MGPHHPSKARRPIPPRIDEVASAGETRRRAVVVGFKSEKRRAIGERAKHGKRRTNNKLASVEPLEHRVSGGRNQV